MKLLSFRSLWSVASVNAWYTGYAATTPGIAGSLMTFLYYIAGIWALINATYRRYTLRLPRRAAPFAVAAVVYPIIMLLTSLAAENRGDLPKAMLPLAALPLAPLVIARYRHADPQRAWLMFARYAPLGAVAGLAASIVSGSRAGGAGNENVFAVAMAVLAIFSLVGADSSSIRDRLCGFSGYLCAAAGVVLADARTMYPTIAALPIGFFFLGGMAGWRSQIALVVTAILLGVTFFTRIMVQLDAIIQEFRLLGSGIDITSTGLRLRLWEASWRAILDSPFLGYGLQNKMHVVVGLMDERLSWIGFTHVHNAWLDAMVAGGVGAGLALLALLLSPLAMVFGRAGEQRGRRFAVIALVATFLLQSLTGNLVTHDLLAVLLVFPFVLAAACDPAQDDIVLLHGRDGNAEEHAGQLEDPGSRSGKQQDAPG